MAGEKKTAEINKLGNRRRTWRWGRGRSLGGLTWQRRRTHTESSNYLWRCNAAARAACPISCCTPRWSVVSASDHYSPQKTRVVGVDGSPARTKWRRVRTCVRFPLCLFHPGGRRKDLPRHTLALSNLKDFFVFVFICNYAKIVKLNNYNK